MKPQPSPSLIVSSFRNRLSVCKNMLFPFGGHKLHGLVELQTNPPLFIVGPGRSGTTLVRSMLVAGGQIAIPPEIFCLHTCIERFMTFRKQPWTDLVRIILSTFEIQPSFELWSTNFQSTYQKAMHLQKDEQTLSTLIDLVFKSYAQTNFPNANKWGEQSPVHTLYLPWIRSVFPFAKYLYMRRDGKDVIASYLTMGRNFDASLIRYIRCVKCVEQFKKQINPINFLQVDYEDLVQQPTETLRLLTNFADIKFSSKMFDFWNASTTVEAKVYSHHQNLAKPLFTSSIGKWKNTLTSDQVRTIDKAFKAIQ